MSHGSDIHVETSLFLLYLNCGSHNVDRISIQTSPALLISVLCTHMLVSTVMLRSSKGDLFQQLCFALHQCAVHVVPLRAERLLFFFCSKHTHFLGINMHAVNSNPIWYVQWSIILIEKYSYVLNNAMINSIQIKTTLLLSH